MKPKLLVVELWGLGDLVIATPFLQAASQKYAVTLLAKPYAMDLQKRFWQEVSVVPFVAPWTAFKYHNKYRLWNWPWIKMFRLRKELAAQRFDFGLSARWDPRDHLLLWLARARTRLGFPRVGSALSLERALARPEPQAHRYEHWRVMGQALGLEVPAREMLALPQLRHSGEILVHSGAGQPVRVWPLERYHKLVARLRHQNYRVQVNGIGGLRPGKRTWPPPARSPSCLCWRIARARSSETIPGRAIWLRSVGFPPSRCLVRRCPSGLRRCIRGRNGSKAKRAHISLVRTTAGFPHRVAWSTRARKRSGRWSRRLSRELCGSLEAMAGSGSLTREGGSPFASGPRGLPAIHGSAPGLPKV